MQLLSQTPPSSIHIMPPLLPPPSRALSSLFLLLKPSNSFPSSAMSAAVTSTYSPSVPSKPRLRGVVFDMDGTLTVPVIDFQSMYKAVLGDDEYLSVKSQSPAGIDILRHIESWSLDKQHKAFQIITDYERQGLDRLQIMPGVAKCSADIMGLFVGLVWGWEGEQGSFGGQEVGYWELDSRTFLLWTTGASELCGFLDSRNIRRGLITRNVKESVELFHQRFGMLFSPAVSREFRPYKPDPAALFHICATWQVEPHEVMMIGDSLKDDVACGKRAGAHTCLLDETGRYDAPEYANVEFKPDYKVTSLAEVYSLLEAKFDLTP